MDVNLTLTGAQHIICIIHFTLKITTHCKPLSFNITVVKRAAPGTFADQPSKPQAPPSADAGAAGEPVVSHAAASAPGTHVASCQQLMLLLLFYIWFAAYVYVLLCQMRRQAAVGGQLRPSLPNGPLAEPSNHHAGLSCASLLNHTAIRFPSVTQPTANGSSPSNLSTGQLGHLDKNHALGLGGGGASNRNVPYPQQNSLPHHCTAASIPSPSSTTRSPSYSDETWRSQQRNTTTQVSLSFCCSLSACEGICNVSLVVLVCVCLCFLV